MNALTINARWYSISEQHAAVLKQDKYSVEKHFLVYTESMKTTIMMLNECADILKTGKQPSAKKREALLNGIASARDELALVASILPTVSKTFHTVTDLLEFCAKHGIDIRHAEIRG